MNSSSLQELAIVGTRLSEPLTGVGRYFECLLRHWVERPQPFGAIRLYCPAPPRLPPEVLRPPVDVEIVPSRGSLLYWEHIQLAARLRSADLVFGAYSLPWSAAGRGVVSNLGIYEGRWAGGFSPLARLRTRPFYQRAARKSVRVIANSNSTRSDVVEHLGADPNRVEVVLLGADERLGPVAPGDSGLLPESLRARLGLPAGPYFLMVGKLSQRRNVPLLIEAFARARAAAELPHHLVLVGPDYLGVDPASIARARGVADRVFHRTHAPMEDLAELYRRAEAFVLPTEHEGFSLTIPEAMASGAPVLTFDHASLEGCLREAAWVVQPPSAEVLAGAMAEVARNTAKRRDLRERSLRCAAKYQWRTTAERTMEILAAAAAEIAGRAR